MSSSAVDSDDRDDAHPLVSVVLPTYNRPAELARAARSVAAQSYPEIELVVVDDCSTVPAAEVLSEPGVAADLGDLRITHVRHDRNRGANASRNDGIRAATGDLIAFLDDDDEWAPEKLARQVAAFGAADLDTDTDTGPAPEADSRVDPDSDSDVGVGVVYTGMRFVRPGGSTDVCPTLRGTVTRDLLAGRSLSQFSAVMVRASAIEAAGLPDERFPSWQDREWYLRLSAVCAFEPVPEPLCVRRLDADDRISDDFARKRDVSYPLLVETHLPLARRHGMERQFLAATAESLGKTALQTGHYRDARWLLLRALRHDPVRSPRFYGFLVSALGGRPTYRAVQRVSRAVGV